jgi:CPA1 family monovalent cation:H+ antiporter
MHLSIELELIFLLMVITSVAMVIRYLRLPYTIALIFAGIIVSFFNIFPDIHLTPQLIFHVLLPPLLFEAAFRRAPSKGIADIAIGWKHGNKKR